MTDATHSTEVDRDEIDLNDETDVRRRAAEFGVDEDRLRDLVRSVGNNTAAIKSYLQGR